MNIRYDRDGSHNYLITDAGDIDFSSYEYNMLESNNIEGILPLGLRRIDGHPYFYYEIDSMQSLRNRYGQGKLSYEKLKNFVLAFAQVLERLAGYFLDDEKLVLDPECIFEGVSSGKFFFLYLPDYEKAGSFGDMIMELVDTNDEKAVELAYRICEKTIDENANLVTSLREILMEEGEKSEDSSSEKTYLNEESEDMDYEDESEDDDKDAEKRIVKIHIPSKVSILLSVLFALVAGALWYIRVMYYLTLEENIIDLAVLMLCVMMSLISLLASGKGEKKASSKERKPFGFKRRKHTSKKDVDYEDDEDAEDDEEENKDYQIPVIHVPGEVTDEEDCEETVLLGYENRTFAHKLYSNDKEVSNNIELNNLPLTIGKHSSYSDIVVKEPTVSRLHAKIMSEDGEMYIQDLNSRNGTFINGKRLLPNEKVVIIPDDEIAFGKCSFLYR